MSYKSFRVPTKIMYLYVVLTFVTETLGYYSLYISAEKKVNFLLYNIYAPLSFSILSIFFYKIIENENIKKILFILTPLAVLISIYFVFGSSNSKLNYRILLFSMVILSMYCIIFFKQTLNTEENFFSNPHFWIVTGILFFYAGFFFLSGFINYISSKDIILARKLHTINHLLNIVYYSLVTFGFICQRRLMKLS
ncbi:hypothetical protein DVG78_22415 [Runella aurantiaca]|uniref:Uncharacterized protein n=1 Tax=Runella aurantiaca TaxID=2282308 RepID=A0A369I5Y6_9BACT|nr:hypothetical protein DVG78_22415 [Runella aurantiaca]